MSDDTRIETCMLRLFGADPSALAETVERLSPQWKASAEWRSRGAETLLALRADTPNGLKHALRSLRTSFSAEFYGEGDTTLSSAVVETLERYDKILVCSDPAAGALLEARLENVSGADKVFDFGALSYAHPQTFSRIEKRARVRLHLSADETPDPLRLALARAQSARKLIGADLTAGCTKRENNTILVLSTRKGCWVRTIRSDESPALWLLDMIRRAAAGLPQSKGTGFLPARKIKKPDFTPTDASSSKPQRHPLRRVLSVLVVLVLAMFAAAWYWTDGHLVTLPDQLRTLSFFSASSLPHSGATML